MSAINLNHFSIPVDKLGLIYPAGFFHQYPPPLVKYSAAMCCDPPQAARKKEERKDSG